MELTHEQGSASGVATVVLVGTTSIVAAASNQFREAVTFYNGGAIPAFYNCGTNAVASQSFPIPAGGTIEERDYNGDIYIVSPAATLPIFKTEVGF